MASRAISYTNFNTFLMNGTINMLTDPIKVALLASTYDPVSVWAPSVTLAVGAYRQPTAKNGHYYRITTAGTTDTTEPGTWPTGGGTVADGSAVWTDMGTILPITGAEDIVWADVSAHEITGTGYSTGGQLVTGQAIDSTPARSILTGDNVEWLNSTITARYAVRRIAATVGGVVEPLIACTLLNDTPADVSSDGATFAYNWSENGILKLSGVSP